MSSHSEKLQGAKLRKKMTFPNLKQQKKVIIL